MEGPEFQDLYGKLLDTLRSKGTVKSVSEHFRPSCGVEEMFSFLWGLKEAKLTLKPKIIRKEKSEAKADNLRAEGNKYYQKKLLERALNLYNKSILFAPHPNIVVSQKHDEANSNTNSGQDQEANCDKHSVGHNTKEEGGHKSLALGYANRSAVLFELQEYEKCIHDIDLALLHGYPRILHSKLAERKAKCHIALQRYDEAKCVIESSLQALAELSLEEDKTKSSKASLQALSQNCEMKEHSPESDDSPETKNTLLFSYESPSPPEIEQCNPAIPSLSISVELTFSPHQGRYLVAKNDIKPGDVLVVEEAYSKVLHLNSNLQTYCTNCLARCLTPLPCPSCPVVAFCSSACRIQALASYHGSECKILPSLAVLDMGKNSVLACRIMVQTTFSQLKKLLPVYLAEAVERSPERLGFDSVGKYVSSDYRTVYHLVTNKESRSVSDLFKRCAMAVILVKLLEESSNFFVDETGVSFTPTLEDLILTGSTLFRHMMNLPCNAHSITEMKVNIDNSKISTSVEIGAGAFGVLSLTNHSCNPAASRFSFGGTQVLRAVRFIPAGGEITDCYGEHYGATNIQDRKVALQQQYYFQCSCEACEHHWPMFFTMSCFCKMKCVSCQQPFDYRAGRCHKCNLGYLKVSKNEALNVVTYNWKEMAHHLEVARAEYESAYELVLRGKVSPEIIRKTCHLIEFMDKYVHMPCSLYFEVQETLKRCFDLQSPFFLARE